MPQGKRPYLISVECKQLTDIEYKGNVFNKGIYISMIASENQRQLIADTLTHIAEITGVSVKQLDCHIMAVQEISEEQADRFRIILEGARTQDEIDFG